MSSLDTLLKDKFTIIQEITILVSQQKKTPVLLRFRNSSTFSFENTLFCAFSPIFHTKMIGNADENGAFSRTDSKVETFTTAHRFIVQG